MGQVTGAVDIGQVIGAVDMGQDTRSGGGACHNLPDCWKVYQYEYFCKTHPFLMVKEKKLGCKTCTAVKSLGAEYSGKLRYTFSSEWQNCLVGHYGNTTNQMKSLKKKL